jgi:hypothetical protein
MDDITIDQYFLNNDTLAKVVVVGTKQASVKDHVVDALTDKFKGHPEILANLFWVKPVVAPRRPSVKAPDIGRWAEAKSSGRPPCGLRNLKLIPSPTGEPMEYVVRFVGEPVTFYKYYVDGKAAICGDPATCTVRRKYGIEPIQRHAVNLINRADGMLYLVELSPSALQPVVRWAKRRGINPGGIVAVDFSITVSGIRKNTRYEVIPLDISTLTEEEQWMPRYNLERLFQPTPEAEIEARLLPNRSLGNAAGRE